MFSLLKFNITYSLQFEFAFLNNRWCILFSHPFDFTPVCTTELARAAQLAPEFAKRGVKMIALSCNEAGTHNNWIKDIQAYGKLEGKVSSRWLILRSYVS